MNIEESVQERRKIMEEYLIKRCKSGDMEAFELLIEQYQVKIYNVAYRMMGNEQDAFDMAQEICIKIYRSIEQFSFQSKFFTWVYRITVNTCLDELRKMAKERTVGEDIEQLRMIDHRPNPEETYLIKEQRGQIEEAITTLAEEYRMAIILRDLQEMTYEEISGILELPLGTVKSRIARGRRQLQEKIGDLYRPRTV